MELSLEIRDRQSALAYLYGRIDYERANHIPYQEGELKLDRMRDLLDRLGNPQSRLPIIHLAGTKGKGSTAAMIAAILTAAGYRTGLYTSPHLQGLEERFVIDGTACTPNRLVELTRSVRQIADEMDREAELLGQGKGPTFFEITTAMALLHFARAGAAAAVLEVGLGGRLDSTNVCQPRVSVVTTISYDHTKQLGNTLASIAAEKAGIIKPGVPVVTGVVEPEPLGVIAGIARDRNARLYALGTDFDFQYDHASASNQTGRSNRQCELAATRLNYWDAIGGQPRRIDNLHLGLLGRHQAANAAVALAAIGRLQELGWDIPEQALRAGLAGVRCPARIECVSRRPTVVIDVSHNVASVEALCQTLDESFPAGPRILLFAVSHDKDARGMLRCLLPRFDRILLTQFMNNPRRADPQVLLELAEEARGAAPKSSGVHLEVCADPAAAWGRARALAGAEDLICVTGSFFIAAEVQALLAELPPAE